jgi:hypothetical protein
MSDATFTGSEFTGKGKSYVVVSPEAIMFIIPFL